MTSMVEKVARASFLADYPNDNWERFGEQDHVKLRYRRMARASIEAMRDPSRDMLTALVDADIGIELAAVRYNALIDSALG